MSESETQDDFEVPALTDEPDSPGGIPMPDDADVREAEEAETDRANDEAEQARKNQSLKQQLQEKRSSPDNAVEIELYGVVVPFKPPTSKESSDIRKLATNLESEHEEGVSDEEQSDAVFDAAERLAEHLAEFCLDESMSQADDWHETFGVSPILEVSGLLLTKADEGALSKEDREEMEGFR